jgi:hypothetical protein
MQEQVGGSAINLAKDLWNKTGLDIPVQHGAIMLDKPVIQKLPVVKDYGAYVMNGNTDAFIVIIFVVICRFA